VSEIKSELHKMYLRGLVIRDIRKHEKTIRNLTERHGDGFNPSTFRLKLALANEIYLTLGGDPDEIDDEGLNQ
jgi:hypothetical protein